MEQYPSLFFVRVRNENKNQTIFYRAFRRLPNDFGKRFINSLFNIGESEPFGISPLASGLGAVLSVPGKLTSFRARATVT
ncbi:hypothetical protein CEXT_476221 [Caerostris extrusa]|uniref:Uncharacterized protein n=1 Tax=Caerostris extrusa TaxID=172846 RepID=A0AAV4TG09_CAEEX|nr:hypothetical protein CEXT_476221 [Caerostris extrusa]